MGKETTILNIEDLATRPDITEVYNKDPNFHYRWVEDDPIRIQVMKREGYEFVHKDEVEVDETFAKGDGADSLTPNLPELRLMRRPKDLHNKIVATRVKRFNDMAKRDEEEAIEQMDRALKKLGAGGLKRKIEDRLGK